MPPYAPRTGTRLAYEKRSLSPHSLNQFYRKIFTQPVESFRAEEHHQNPGFATAQEALRRYFSDVGPEAPVRAAEFLRGTVEDSRRVRDDLVTVAKFLLGEKL